MIRLKYSRFEKPQSPLKNKNNHSLWMDANFGLLIRTLLGSCLFSNADQLISLK